MIEAVKLANRNESARQALAERFAEVEERSTREREEQEAARRRVYDDALTPFAETFSRLKNVDLAELALIGDLVEADLPDVELRDVQLDAVGAVTALVGGAVAGAGLGALTWTAVGAFAAASTGTAISTLTGAAATSATLAWLGGGSLAAGGGGVAAGTLVLTGIIAVPVVLSVAGFVEWKGRGALGEQREVKARLEEAAAELDLLEASAEAVCERSRDVRALLDDLRAALLERLPGLRALVDEQADYSLYGPAQRTQVAVTVALATAAVAVMSTRIADEDGRVTDLSQRVVADARTRLSTLVEAG
ncbi:hypothetical protein [Microbispora sp. CA-102843]|uniref:hypothetical protein n=1 Tax=Microbispora sp. CA-102843 TaxID=3239952 RepID=UPI003D93C62C